MTLSVQNQKRCIQYIIHILPDVLLPAVIVLIAIAMAESPIRKVSATWREPALVVTKTTVNRTGLKSEKKNTVKIEEKANIVTALWGGGGQS